MEKACIDINKLINVFSTTHGTVYQSDKLHCLYVDFGGKFAKFNLNGLKKLKQTVQVIDIEQMLLRSTISDIEIITFSGCEHIYILNALEIIALKELLQGAFTMFKLNHIISDCLYRLVY